MGTVAVACVARMSEPPLRLLNCRHCDDIVKLIETERLCECGKTRGFLRGEELVITGSPRVFALEWEAYDGIAEGESRAITRLTLAR